LDYGLAVLGYENTTRAVFAVITNEWEAGDVYCLASLETLYRVPHGTFSPQPLLGIPRCLQVHMIFRPKLMLLQVMCLCIWSQVTRPEKHCSLGIPSSLALCQHFDGLEKASQCCKRDSFDPYRGSLLVEQESLAHS